MRHLRRVVVYSVSVCVLFHVSVTRSAEPTESPQNLEQAAASVAEALRSEAAGDFLARQRHLVEAERSGDYAPAKWHRGKLMQPDGSWSDIASSISMTHGDRKLDEYERRRAGLADSMASHYSIATWCANEGLFDQCRSHLNRVLAFDTDNVLARRALGYRAVGGEWISPQEIAQVAQRTKYAAESIRRFGGLLYAIVTKISSPDAKLQQEGIAALLKVTDPLAVPAVESAFSSAAPAMSRIAIDWLASVDVVESSQALARYSLFYPQANIRAYATVKLKERPLHDFVPDMLGMLASPVSTMIVPSFNRDGTLAGYRQAFSQQKFDKTDFVVLDRVFLRQTVAARPRIRTVQPQQPGALDAAVANARVEASLREFVAGESARRAVAMRVENVQLEQRNARIGEVIAAVSDRESTTNAKKMWDWWDKYNETAYQNYKPQRYRRSAVANEVPVYTNAVRRPTTTPGITTVRTGPGAVGGRAGECFAANTKVVTHRGLRAISKIVVGDIVLSRNVQTGELNWKPVLRSTTRPPEKTLTVSIGDERFQCTTGHLFWVSGAGWQKASELKPGDVLHAAEEPTVVAKVTTSQVLPTFNLQVADNGTYFVGKNMVMTHDVMPRRHNRQLVPGQQLVGFFP